MSVWGKSMPAGEKALRQRVAGPESEDFFSDQNGQPFEVCSRAWRDLTGLKRCLLPHRGEHTAI